MNRTVVRIVFTALLLSPMAATQRMERFVAQDPYEVVSPSGSMRIQVEPLQRSGPGPCVFRWFWKGSLERETELPFTFRNVAVTDLGYVVGHADVGRLGNGYGDFLAAVVAPDGSIVLQESIERVHSRWFHGLPEPRVYGIVVDPAGSWFVVRVGDPAEASREVWWRYPVGSEGGKETLDPHAMLPERDKHSFLLGARAVPDTPWILMHWRCRAHPHGDGGALFMLADHELRPAWTLELPGDYVVEGSSESNRLSTRLRELGAVRDVGSRRFSLWHVADGEQVDYEIEDGGSAEVPPSVRETGRRPFDPLDVEGRPVELPRLSLPVAKRVTLQVGSKPALRDLVDFGFGVDGHPIAIRRDGPGRFTALHLHAGGGVARDVALEPVPDELTASVTLHALQPGHWLIVAQSESSVDKVVPFGFFRVDVETGGSERLHAVEHHRWPVAPRVEDAAALSDGGFAALCRFSLGSTLVDQLIRFDASGRVRWAIDQVYEDPTKLFSPDDIAALPDGGVAVLENVCNRIQIYSPDGQHRGTIDLEQTLGKEANYPTALHVDADGNLLMHDFQGDPPLVTLTVDGRVVAQADARPAEGSWAKDLNRFARPGPEGRLWTMDGNALFVLDADGRVERVIGEATSSERLDQPGIIHIDALGRTWILDGRTRILHGFGEDGRRSSHVDLSRFNSRWGDIPINQPDVLALPDGGLLGQSQYADVAIRVGADGHVDGRMADLARLRVMFDDGRSITLGEEDRLQFRSADGRVETEITHMPDGRWMRTVFSAALIGGIHAVLRADDHLLFVDAAGRIDHVVAVPRSSVYAHRIAAAGTHVLLSSWSGGSLLYDVDADRWTIVTPDGVDSHEQGWSMNLSPDGRSLLAVHREDLAILHCPLP